MTTTNYWFLWMPSQPRDETVYDKEHVSPNPQSLPSSSMVGEPVRKRFNTYLHQKANIKAIVQGILMSQITLKVNGAERVVTVDRATPLLFVLNDELQLRGPRFGCGMAQCGACTVLLEGRVVRSCVMPVGAVGNDEITTLEGLGTPQQLHPLQRAFLDEGAAQCGFCLSGVILTAKAVLDAKPDASDLEIREALGGVLCRCFTHTRMLRAIRKYADRRKHHGVTS
jgi:nicotinate dehydrogenase subunit A